MCSLKYKDGAQIVWQAGRAWLGAILRCCLRSPADCSLHDRILPARARKRRDQASMKAEARTSCCRFARIGASWISAAHPWADDLPESAPIATKFHSAAK